MCAVPAVRLATGVVSVRAVIVVLVIDFFCRSS